MNMTLGKKVRGLRLSTFHDLGLPYLQQLVNENIDSLIEIFHWNHEHQIMMFRLPSDLIPLGSHEEVDLATLVLPRTQEIIALTQDMRLSMHPGQYTLPSATGAVWQRSYRDLCYHAFLLDHLGKADSDIILHGGGVYGDRVATSARIVANIRTLPTNVRQRLRLENDERSWSIADLLPICETVGTPLVVDTLHHTLNGGSALATLPWERILATWHGKRPKLHYSDQDPTRRPGAHSEYVNAQSFHAFQSSIPFAEYDVMLECKAKEKALLQLRDDLACTCS
jgi:UV DNA damage endonuclease